MVVVNKGVGPAQVRSVQGLRRRQAAAQLGCRVRGAGVGNSNIGQRIRHSTAAIVLSAGERLDQLLFRSAEDFNAYTEQVDRVELSMCYCSTLNECWVYDGREKIRRACVGKRTNAPREARDGFIDNERPRRLSRRRKKTNERNHTDPPQGKEIRRLVGVAAGNTALCTVGRTGNDLHYRGYDILDVADDLRVRGNGAPARARQAAEPRPS